MSKKIESGSTKDYSLFKINSFNRGLKSSKIKEIMRIMAARESKKLSPFIPGKAIVVQKLRGGLFLIKEGHHRFAAAEQYGAEIFYIVDNSDFDMLADSSYRGKDWNVRDIIIGFANAGNKEYRDLLLFSSESRIGITVCCAIMNSYSHAAGSDLLKELRTGKFKIKNLSHARGVVSAAKSCHEAGVVFAFNRSFVLALSNAMSLDIFDIEKFLTRVRNEPTFMKRRGTVGDYIEEIENVYNRRNREPIPLRYLWDSKKMTRRKSTKGNT
jgi:hypothetical protein